MFAGKVAYKRSIARFKIAVKVMTLASFANVVSFRQCWKMRTSSKPPFFLRDIVVCGEEKTITLFHFGLC